MSVYNNVNLIGRLTKLPTLQTTNATDKGKGGKEYCNFTLAVQRVGYEGADFIYCTAWGGTAKYLCNEKWVSTKDVIAVNGEIQTYYDGDKNNVVSVRVVGASKVAYGKQEEGNGKQDDVKETTTSTTFESPTERVVVKTETFAEKQARLKQAQGDDYGIEETEVKVSEAQLEEDLPF